MRSKVMTRSSIGIGDRVAFQTNTDRRRIGRVIGVVNDEVLQIESDDRWCVFRLAGEVERLDGGPAAGEAES